MTSPEAPKPKSEVARTLEFIVLYKTILQERISFSVTGEACVVNLGGVVLTMQDMGTFKLVSGLPDKERTGVIDYFKDKGSTLAIELAVKKMDKMGYSVQNIGVLIPDYVTRTNYLPSFSYHQKFTTQEEYINGFFCTVKKKPEGSPRKKS